MTSETLVDKTRPDLRTPLDIMGRRRHVKALTQRYLAALGGFPDAASRGAVAAAYPMIDSQARFPLLTAIEASMGQRSQDADRPVPIRAPTCTPPNLAFARRVLRTLDWSSGATALRALWHPAIVAVSHNYLLSRAARRSAELVGFRHAESILCEALERSRDRDLGDWREIADRLTDLLLPEGLDDEHGKPLRSRILGIASATLQFVRRAQLALAAYADLPRRCWSGSGGNMPARLIGLEVMRRGGDATRFAHGGSFAVVDEVHALAATEFIASSKVIFETRATADIVVAGRVNDYLGDLKVAVSGSDGDPFMLLPTSPPRAVGKRRVMYVPTCLSDGIVAPIPTYPDPVYIDFQHRLVAALSKSPVDIVVQPHPRDIDDGRRHPLDVLAMVNRGRFETVIDDADILVFDYPHSTTFAQALCSAKPIVFLDSWGGSLFNDFVRDHVAARCRVVDVRPSAEGNLPEFDAEALRDAVCGAVGAVDATVFRSLLGGAT